MNPPQDLSDDKTQEKPEATGPKVEPPIDPPKPPTPPKKNGGKGDGKGDGKCGGKIDIHIHIDEKKENDDSIHISDWVKITDPRDKDKATKRKAWQRVQTHRTKKGVVWFITEQVSDNGEILGVQISGEGVPAGAEPSAKPFKQLSKTRDALSITDKN